MVRYRVTTLIWTVHTKQAKSETRKGTRKITGSRKPILSPRPGNSHDGSEESVTRNLDNAPKATQVPDAPASQDQPLPETPSVFSRFFRSSGVTERQKAANDDTSLPSQNQATFQARLLQLQFDNDAAVLATSTAESTARIAKLTATAAEADARTAAARRTTKLMDLESR